MLLLPITILLVLFLLQLLNRSFLLFNMSLHGLECSIELAASVLHRLMQLI